MAKKRGRSSGGHGRSQDKRPKRGDRDDRRDSRGEGRSGKKTDESSRSESGRGDFVFRDRSGKVHGSAGGAVGDGGRDRGRGERYEKSRPAGASERFRRGGFERPSRSQRGRDSDQSVTPDSSEFREYPRKKPSHEKPRESRRSRPDRGDRGDRGGQGQRDEYAGYLRLKATVDKNKRGFGFLQFENRDYEDAFLNPREAEKFFHGDRVEAVVSPEGEVVDLRVLEHRFRELVGRFYPIGENGTIIYERRKAREEIRVQGSSMGAKSRDWVRAKLVYPAGARAGFGDVLGEIQAVYGQDLPSEADIGMVAAEYNLIEHHSEQAVEEAKAHRLDLNDPHRVDLRNTPFITIDGETARDFDDAVFVEKDGDGFILWVAIADVSHYVKEGTVLNAEAYSRATSVYFPERAFHMLPGALSENLCSLRPNEPRLTMTAKIHLDSSGKRTRVEVMNTLIESRRRATYTQMQEEWEKNRENSAWEYAAHFELYQLMRKRRADRGSIDFDLPEAEIRVDAGGEPISIKNRPRLDAHRLIEEFMISANEAVTDWAMERGSPFIYRVHEEPSPAALERFQNLCAHNGVNLVIDERDVAGSLNRLIQSIEGHPSQTLLNMALLRSMPQARYSAAHAGHFGLASKGYTHFTSPIRRYPDLIVHRILKELIEHDREKRALAASWKEDWNSKLEMMAEHCSYRERIASDAERDSIKLKQVRIMLKEVGNEFEGKVNGMMENGIFVGIPDPFVEGVIPKESMTDDHYEFAEERMVFVGKRKRRVIHIGDRVKIQVMKVDFDLRTIDFEMLEHTPSRTDRVFTVPEGSRGTGRDRGGRGRDRDRGGRSGRGGRDDRRSKRGRR